MKRVTLYCLTIVLFAAAPLHAQPDSLWSRTYGGDHNEGCTSLIQTADGGYALGGYTRSFGAGESDFWLVRTDENGDSLWSRTYGGKVNDGCYSLIQTTDGGFALAGYTSSFGAGQHDFWLVRTDENGDSLWSHTYGGQRSDACYIHFQTSDGGYVLAGYSNSFGAGDFDFWLVRTDENGDSLWSRTFGGQDWDMCESLVQTADGGFALAGFTSSFGSGEYDFWLVKTDKNGDSLWSRTYGGQNIDYCNSLVQTSDGGYALVGDTDSFGAGRDDFWLVRTDENGDSLWSRTYGGGGNEWCNSLVQTEERGFALAGMTWSIGAGEGDFWLLRTNENGDSLWSRTYGGQNQDNCSSLILTTEGGYALAGGTQSFGAGEYDFWLVKLGPENSIPNNGVMTPVMFGLNGVYPNPFNSQAVASYELRVASWVSLELYDLSGRMVHSIMDGWQAAGLHQAVIDASGQPGMSILPSGVYLLKLTDGRQEALSKICLVR